MVEHLSGPLPLDDARPGVTFAVDEVEPADTPLPTEATSAISERIGRTLVASDEGADAFVAHPWADGDQWWTRPVHALFETVHRAFAEHRPLVLSPDAIWLTIAQGVADHIRLNAERLRDRVVPFDGKRQLVVARGRLASELTVGDWAEAIGEFASEVGRHTEGGAVPPLECSFSTTTPAARVASQVCLLDAHRRYFDYVAVCVCGFPQVTLLGTPSDWEEIRRRVARLDALDLGWWTERLRPICDAFVETAAGRPDVQHWQRMYKLREAYGTDKFNGWFGSLFAYVRERRDDPPRRRNPLVLGEEDALGSFVLPNGLSSAPCRVDGPAGSRMYEFVGGFTGVRQHGSLALEPVIGWGVAEGGSVSNALLRIRESEHHRVSQRTQDLDWRATAAAGFIELMEDFETVELHVDDPSKTVRLLTPDNLPLRRDADGVIVGRRDVFGFGPADVPLTFAFDDARNIIVAMELDDRQIPIAASFEAFLERCLDDGAYFTQPDFEAPDIKLR